jgi:hypothetical protein
LEGSASCKGDKFCFYCRKLAIIREDREGGRSIGLTGGGACPEARRSAMVSLQALDAGDLK